MCATVKTRRKSAARSKAIVQATSRAFEDHFRNPARETYVLRLYITGTTPRSCMAVANIRSICEQYLPGRHDLEVIDIYQQPDEASAQQIIAAPTLIKQYPHPPRRMVGDLSDRERVLSILNLNSTSAQPADA